MIALDEKVRDWIAKLEADGDSNKGKLNIYVCPKCFGHTVTRDLETGVTPFMIQCPAKDCGGLAKSSFYRVFDQSMRASHVWYRPDHVPDLSHMADHVLHGGLLMREAEGDEGLSRG